MTYLHAIILGLIEGITEFLPISSTGHLILAGKLLHLPSTEFLKSFDIVIQLGAILAVVALYAKKLVRDPSIIKRLIVAFIPTVVIGLALHSIVKKFFFGNELIVLAALFVGGIALIVFEKFHTEREADTSDLRSISYRQAFIIGLCQAVAIIPGVSRSAATIVGGLSLGIHRVTIVEFSFLLAIPTMAAATGLDLLKNASPFSSHDVGLLAIGFIVAFLSAWVSVKWLLRYVQHHSFISFGIYRVIIAVIFFIWYSL